MNSRDKILGMLMGLHAGDSLGATLEFEAANLAPIHKEIIGGGSFNWKAGDATDDTDLAIVVLKSIQSGVFDQKTCIQGLIDWYRTNPKDIGNSTRWGIEQLILNRVPSVREDAQGNGSLMRTAPLALIDNLSSAIDQCSLTHPHPTCVLADQIFIQLLKSALSGSTKEEIYRQALILSKANSILFTKINDIPNKKWEELETSGFVLDTLSAAVWGLYHGKTFEESLVLVVNRGDDADTTGAVTGALCGAFYGLKEIPTRWVKVLQHRNLILSLAKPFIK